MSVCLRANKIPPHLRTVPSHNIHIAIRQSQSALHKGAWAHLHTPRHRHTRLGRVSRPKQAIAELHMCVLMAVFGTLLG